MRIVIYIYNPKYSGWFQVSVVPVGSTDVIHNREFNDRSTTWSYAESLRPAFDDETARIVEIDFDVMRK